MAETTTNRGALRIAQAGLTALDLRAIVFHGTQTGVHDRALNTLADLDAVASVVLGSERIALASKTVTEDDANNRAVLGANTVNFAAQVGQTAQGVAVYEESGGTDATRNLVWVYTTGFPVAMDGGLAWTLPNGLARANALTG